MLNPELFDLHTHYINCKTVEESVELWSEIYAALSIPIPVTSSLKRFHREEGSDVTYRIKMSDTILIDWGWDNRRYFEAHGHKIMEFNEALSSPDLGDIVSNEAVDINGLFCSCEVTV